MFDPLFDLIARLLSWFYLLWPSYGAAIAMLTLLVMIAATPLTLKGIRSMLKMQEHSAEIKRIQNEHRGDREAITQATTAFYRDQGINPLGGCLPLFVQGPVFLVLYQVVRGLTRRTTEIGTQFGFTSLQYSDNATPTLPSYAETPVSRGELTFDPDFLSTDTKLYTSLSENTEMVSWGIDLSRSASAALSEGIIEAFPYFIMLILVLVTGLYQHNQIQKRQPQGMINPQTQMIMRLVPYFLPIVSFTIPAAVVVYFIMSALYRIAQQAYITKSYYSGEDSLGARAARQRAAAAEEGRSVTQSKQGSSRSGQRSAKSARGGSDKGTEASRRNATESSSRVPARPQRTSNSDGARGGQGTTGSRSGRTGKAPSRNRLNSARTRGESSRGSYNPAPTSRTTPKGTNAQHGAQNRSKNKRKRR